MKRADRGEIALGVTGSIAAYKAVQLTSDLVKKDIGVTVIMTRNALRFVTPLSFEALSGRPVITDIQCDPEKRAADHVALAEICSVLVVAPASANIIGKLACGIADDALSTLALAFPGRLIVAPAMNTLMWDNPIVRQNVERLKEFGCTLLEPEEGRLADGKTGAGRLADLAKIVQAVEKTLRKRG